VKAGHRSYGLPEELERLLRKEAAENRTTMAEILRRIVANHYQPESNVQDFGSYRRSRNPDLDILETIEANRETLYRLDPWYDKTHFIDGCRGWIDEPSKEQRRKLDQAYELIVNELTRKKNARA
jgi:hypothetical protein